VIGVLRSMSTSLAAMQREKRYDRRQQEQRWDQRHKQSGTMPPPDESLRKTVAISAWIGGGCTFHPPTPPLPLIPYNVVVFVVVVPSTFLEDDRTRKNDDNNNLGQLAKIHGLAATESQSTMNMRMEQSRDLVIPTLLNVQPAGGQSCHASHLA
jgi:hypothetical protein